jgi:hypothetical protein
MSVRETTSSRAPTHNCDGMSALNAVLLGLLVCNKGISQIDKKPIRIKQHLSMANSFVSTNTMWRKT